MAALACLFCVSAALAQHDSHAQHHGMQIAPAGIVMNENINRLPRGCESISGELDVTIRAGRQYADDEPGVIFGMSPREISVKPCTRVTVQFVNEDSVRHQWMVHGLPRYLYPGGMFHIEAMGGGQQSGTFIVPAEDRNFLIHCDMAQHMEKGMRGQLVVGEGSGKLWGITGLSDAFRRAHYLPGWAFFALAFALLTAFGAVLTIRLRANHK